MFEDKRCEESLGLEKLAVGRSDLLPLRGTANSPFTFMIYCAQGLSIGQFPLRLWYNE